MIVIPRLLRRCFLSCLLIPLTQAKEPPPLPDDFPVLMEEAPDNAGGFAVFSKQLPSLPLNAASAKLIYRQGEYVHDYSPGNVDLPAYWAGEDAEGNPRAVSRTRTFTENLRILPVSKDGRHRMRGAYGPEELVFQKTNHLGELKKLFEVLGGDENENRWEIRRLLQQQGELLLYAVRLHELGYTDQANQLAGHLFERGGKRNVLMAGLSSLTDAAWEDLLREFEQEKNPAAFVTAAEELLNSKGSRWRMAEQLAEKLPEWKADLDRGPDSLPDVPGVTLSGTQARIYRQLVEEQGALLLAGQLWRRSNWLLTPASLMEKQYQQMLSYSEDTDKLAELFPILRELHALGADAVPLFRVMLADTRFVTGRIPDSSHSRYSRRYSHHSSNELPPLNTPQQFKDLAVEILATIKPNDENWNKDELDAFGEAVMSFYHLLEGMNRFERAGAYLDRRGDYGFPAEALYTLLSSENADDRERVLQFPLEPDHFQHQLLALYSDYFQYNEEEAKTALQRLKTAMLLKIEAEAEEDGNEDAHEYERMQIKQMDALLNPETESTGNRDLSTALDEWIALDDMSNQRGMMELLETFKQTSNDQVQTILADRIQGSPFSISTSLLQWMSHIQQIGGAEHLSMMGGMHQDQMKYYLKPEATPETDSEDTEPETPRVTWIPEVWLPLLNNVETVRDRNIAIQLASHLLFLEVRAVMAEHPRLFQTLYMQSGTAYEDRLIEIGRFLLQKPDEDWTAQLPSADAVADERKQEILRVLSEESPEAAHELLQTLSLNEEFFLAETVVKEELELSDELLTALIPQRLTMLKFHGDPGYEDLVGVQEGDPLTLDTFNNLLKNLREAAGRGEKGMITLQSHALNKGVTLYFQRHMIPDTGMDTGGIQVAGSLGDGYLDFEFGAEDDLRLETPQGDEAESVSTEQNFEAMFQNEEDESPQNQQLARALHHWLTAPLDMEESQGQLMILYTPAADPEETQDAN